jgi:hypothetical protein
MELVKPYKEAVMPEEQRILSFVRVEACFNKAFNSLINTTSLLEIPLLPEE